MSDNYKDILSNLSTEVDQKTLLLYLQGKLSEDKRQLRNLLIQRQVISHFLITKKILCM